MAVTEADWETFVRRHFRWKQGEHVTLIGPTGRGKTTLAKAILPMRKYVVVFATKRRDPLIQELKDGGYESFPWWEGNREIAERVILQPPLSKGKKSLPKQREAFEHGLFVAFKQGAWAVYLDEARYICDTLGLAADCELLWQQGRSLGVSMIAGTQRPVKIPLTAYDQATHLFFWNDNDKRNLERIGGLGGIDSALIRERVASLDLHQVLYLNTRTGVMVKTKVS